MGSNRPGDEASGATGRSGCAAPPGATTAPAIFGPERPGPPGLRVGPHTLERELAAWHTV